MSGWGRQLANIWTNNVPPSRPSVNELCLYTKYLRIIQKKLDRRVRLLVLGSTPEFRDWGFEQNLEIHIVDKSEEYYHSISRELRHKNIKETLHLSHWEDMLFDEQFDLILGDLAIGNIEHGRLDDFLLHIKKALSPNGFFLGKSFLWDDTDIVKSPREIISEYKSVNYIHPYTFINHQLGLYCLDKETYSIDFSRMYQEILSLKAGNEISDEIFAFFENVGWNTEMKFLFYSPPKKYFITQVNKVLKFIKFEYTDDIYTTLFPVFVIGANCQKEVL